MSKMDFFKFGTGEKTFIILPGLSIHSVMGLGELVAQAYSIFVDDYTVYLFDRAKQMDEGYTIRDMAKDTAETMKELGLKKVDVFGASQGGMIGLYLAIDYPELVNKLIVGSSFSRRNRTFDHVCEEWIELAKSKQEEELLGSFVDHVYSETTCKANREAIIAANRGVSDEEYRRFLIQAASFATYDCYDELPKIQCPVLVLGSEGDQVTTPEGARQMAEKLHCECYIYGNEYGHGVCDEAPDYVKRCYEFLTRK